LKIEFLESPSQAEVSSIYEGLREFNLPHLPGLYELEFGVFIRNDELQIIGGAIGNIILSVMHIKYLWLTKAIRGQGIGSNIIATLEANAKSRGLKSITLDTYSFQAPDFYTKMGFLEVGKFENYPCTGIDKLFFQKNLTTS
jgi:GNAT superfamily N-acetyltransferase